MPLLIFLHANSFFSFVGIFFAQFFVDFCVDYLQKLKGSNLVNRLVIKNACGFGENGSVNGSPISPNKVFMEEVLRFFLHLSFF